MKERYFKVRKTASWIAVVLWMGLIFNLSSQSAVISKKLSLGITKINIKVIEKIKPDTKLDSKEFEHMLRKNAHFFVYLVLGGLVLNALKRSGISGHRCMILALIVCILYAISDELHQFYIPGRGAQVKDVIIDSAGTVVGIFVYSLISNKKVIPKS